MKCCQTGRITLLSLLLLGLSQPFMHSIPSINTSSCLHLSYNIYAPLISIRSDNILVFSSSCGVELGDLYVVTGGIENPNLPNNLKPLGIRKVGLYNDNGFIRNLPDLVMERYDHACAGFQDINGDMVSMILFYS